MARTLLPLLLIVSWLGRPWAGEGSPPAPDPWKGKGRSEVVELLGPPQKRQTSKAGETLSYRLVRVEQADLADPTLTLLDVPGVGLVGQRLDEGPGSTATISVEPTVFDEDGHPSGGVTTTESRSTSWSKEGGKVVRSEEPEIKAPRKIKLTFRIDAGGRVADWSVEPKSAGAVR